MPFDPISYLEALKSRKLSNLIVDTDKDWRGRLIKNLGDPVDPNDVVRKIYVDLIVSTFNITYYLLDTQDADVSDYKEVSITPVDTGVNYTEVSSNTTGEVYVDGWISPTGATPSTIVAGTYILTVQAEKVSGNIDVRLFFRLYERQSNGTEVLIAESNRTNLFKEKAILTCSMILESDYTLQPDSRLVLKVYVEYASGGSNTTVRVYYKGDTASRFTMPSTKDVLDALYFSPKVVTVTSNYNANYGDIVLVDASGGAVTVTLPPPKANAIINVKKIDSSSNAVTIDGNGANIDGQSSIQITTQYESYTLVSDGSNWWII